MKQYLCKYIMLHVCETSHISISSQIIILRFLSVNCYGCVLCSCSADYMTNFSLGNAKVTYYSTLRIMISVKIHLNIYYYKLTTTYNFC